MAEDPGRDRVRRAVDAALVPVVASLASWEVTEAHWLPDRDGIPVIWLRCRTLAQQRALAGQVWLPAQLQMTLMRLGVPHDVVRRTRIEVTSAEAEARLFDEPE